MCRFSCRLLLAVLLCSIFTTVAVAEEHLVAKVYRDYPGYIEPPTCLNPRLAPTSSFQPEIVKPVAEKPATEIPPAVSTGESGNKTDKSGNKTDKVSRSWPTRLNGHLYGGVWGGSFSVAPGDLDVGSVAVDIDYDHGYAAAVLVGYDFGPVRFDLEGSYRRTSINNMEVNGFDAGSVDGDLEVEAIILNGYYDFRVNDLISPYLGAGFGWAKASLDGVEAANVPVVDDEDTAMVGQVSAGMLFALTDSALFDVGYRCLFTEDLNFRTPYGKADMNSVSHTVLVGLQFNF